MTAIFLFRLRLRSTNHQQDLDMKHNLFRAAAIGATLLSLAVGCSRTHEDAASREDGFPMFDHRPDVARMMNAQAIVGARKDATLRDAHFDGTQLNSLGREKLALMLHREPADQPQPIYLDLDGPNKLAQQRRRGVVRYLEDAGIDMASIKINDGPNPDNSHPAAPSIARLSKTETMQGEGGPGAIGPDAGTTTTGGAGGTSRGMP
jgi:hypothetical protein